MTALELLSDLRDRGVKLWVDGADLRFSARKGTLGKAAAAGSVNFVAQAAIEDDIAQRLGVHKEFAAIGSTRRVTKADMRENDALPRVEVDADSFTVTIDGEAVEPAPAAELPMAQRYFLF